MLMLAAQRRVRRRARLCLTWRRISAHLVVRHLDLFRGPLIPASAARWRLMPAYSRPDGERGGTMPPPYTSSRARPGTQGYIRQRSWLWVPAFAGMTNGGLKGLSCLRVERRQNQATAASIAARGVAVVRGTDLRRLDPRCDHRHHEPEVHRAHPRRSERHAGCRPVAARRWKRWHDARPTHVIPGSTRDPGLHQANLAALGPGVRRDDGTGDPLTARQPTAHPAHPRLNTR
jgi:hypothetical protein